MLVIFFALIIYASTETLNELIYTPIEFDNILCFRMNSYNSQTGCQTNRDGDSGILYPLNPEEKGEDILADIGNPFIGVIKASDFTNATVKTLVNSPLTKGLLVLEETSGVVSPYSPEKSCPGNGFNYGENASEISQKEQCLNDKLWNPHGNWLSHMDIPFGIFIIRQADQKAIIDQNAKSNVVNGSLKGYPLWGGEMKSFMNAALNTPTCMRRGTCDPVSGLNIIVHFTPPSVNPKKTIILFTVKADATAFFKDLSYGGEASGGSIITLLAVMNALSQVRDADAANDFQTILSSEFMVAFLQGESFDYSGSQRLAYSLSNGEFGKLSYNITLDDVKCVIELGPISLSNEIYVHSYNSDSTVDEVKGLFSNYNADGAELSFLNSSSLPPCSFNSFLRENENVPGVFLTDGGSHLFSKDYGSRFDILENTSNLADRHKLLAETIANVALQLANGTKSENVSIDKTFVTDLQQCILVNQNCSLLQRLLNKTNLMDERLSRYASVGHHTSNYSNYLVSLVKDITKKDLNLEEDKCTNTTYSKGWRGYWDNGTCYGFIVNGTSALSPAFLLGDYSSTQYSTWTESRWSPSFMLRVFIVASAAENLALFFCGVLYFVVLSLFLIQCHRRSSQIFSVLPP